ncbi:MAG: hypothetical protein QOH41_4089 [Blastocatellia bacterium]|jgi:hypothetical protein|nr:hypothetical protein [Blastocatellia bacterium]
MAHRFIGGITPQLQTSESVQRTTETLDVWDSAVHFTDCFDKVVLIPAVNCWAIIIRPLRGLARMCSSSPNLTEVFSFTLKA